MRFFNFLSGLSVGLLIAVMVFFYGDDVADLIDIDRSKVEAPLLSSFTDGSANSADDTSVPEPEFTFYNILPNKEVDISEWMTGETVEDKPPEPETKGNYILQVGSFKQHKAADQVKARLALLGFQAYIEPGVINGEGTFRVRIGPYENLGKLKSARERLLANNLDFMQMRL